MARPSADIKRLTARQRQVKTEIRRVEAEISRLAAERDRLKIAEEVLASLPEPESCEIDPST